MLFASGQKDLRAGSPVRINGGCLCAQYKDLDLEYSKGSGESYKTAGRFSNGAYRCIYRLKVRRKDKEK